MSSHIAEIRIKNLRLRTFIGFNEEEQTKKQDIVINIALRYDAGKACQTDEVKDAFDYKVLTKEIINFVESNSFLLLEKMASDILDLIKTNEMLISAEVEIDKPHALRFADSVSVRFTHPQD